MKLRFLGCGCVRGKVKVGKFHSVLTMSSRVNCSKNFPNILRTDKVSNFSQSKEVLLERFFFDMLAVLRFLLCRSGAWLLWNSFGLQYSQYFISFKFIKIAIEKAGQLALA